MADKASRLKEVISQAIDRQRDVINATDDVRSWQVIVKESRGRFNSVLIHPELAWEITRTGG